MINNILEEITQVKSILEKARRVFVLTGAGVSAESGVPTFRGGGGAHVWRGMPFEQLSSAQMVEQDLPLVWEWFDYRRGLVSECKPNAAHKTLAKVQQSNRFGEFSVVTQNIDGLHQAAGAENIIELHGSIWQARCLSCKTKQNLREIPEDERPPVCPQCFDSMRPNVILFGEAMPMQAVYEAQEKAQSCDVCFVVGTSALVYPAAELPLIAKAAGAKIIEINPEETPLSAQTDVSLRGKAAEILPLIFAEDSLPNQRLLDDKLIKLTAEQSRKEREPDKENQTESGGETSLTENFTQNNQASISRFMTSETHPLRVDFLKTENFPVLQKLGLTFAPGKKQSGAISGNWNRDLASDLTRLRDEYHTDTLVSLVEESELAELGIADLEYECRNHDIELIKFPLRDVSVPPSLKSFAYLIREIVKRLNQKKTVVIHCKGGLGRAGLTAACSVAAASGNKISGSEAIKTVRTARTGTVETREQENFVTLFGEYWQLYSEKIEDLLRQQKTAVKESVLKIGVEGGGLELFRFQTRDGKQYFYTEGSSITIDENDDEDWISWETELVESLAEGIDSFKLGYQIFCFHPILIHPEFRADLKQYLIDLYESLSTEEKSRSLSYDDVRITPESWLARVDERTEQGAVQDKLDAKFAEAMDAAVDQWEAIMEIEDDAEREAAIAALDEEKTQTMENLSDKHFLLYWQERNVIAHEESNYPLDVVSSRQLKRAKAGDTLWLVTINQAGELILAGRLKIGEIVDYQTAIRRLNDNSLWDGGFFALPKENEAEFLRRINLNEAAFDLRFANTESDRFVLKNGKINAQQMQSMRELTEESAEMLAQIWETEQVKDDDFDDDFDGLGEEENWAEMLERLRQFVRDEPYNADAHYNFGVACDENDLPQEANAAYRKAIELDPNYLGAYYNLGCNYLRSSELDKSEQSFKAAIRLAPEFAPARFMLGVVYGEFGNFERAINTTKEGLELDPEDPKGYFNVGNFYSLLRDYKKAAEWFEKSAEIEPNASFTFYRLGKCYKQLSEKEKEFDAYLQAVWLAPDFADALFALGAVYAHLTKTEEGKRVAYFETGGDLILSDPRVSFYLGLGNLALGNVDIAQDGQTDLRKMDALLADRLQFFIDRYEPENEETEVAVKEIEAKTAGQERELITFYIGYERNHEYFKAKNIPEMYQQALEFLVDNGLLRQVSLPVATGEKRYILATEPIHPTGKPFLARVEYAGFFMEAHNNREAAIMQLEKLIENVGGTFMDLSLIKLANSLKEHKRKADYPEIGTPILLQLDLGNILGVERFLEVMKDNLTDDAREAIAQWTAEAKQKEKPKNQGLNSNKPISKLNVFQGCLLGGAVGDALGAAIEFDSIQTIRQKFGEQGLTDYALAYGRIGAITDDTQMTLFTAEGILRGVTRNMHKGMCSMVRVIYFAYIRWLQTQGIKLNDSEIQTAVYDVQSWLRDLPELNSRRAPGNSCLSALQSGKTRTIEEPINNSKGCGGVMRVAPVGLVALEPFDLARDAAAITHGHPTGYLSAGVLALIINQIIAGKSLTDAVNHAVYEILPQHANYEETFAACDKAIKLANDQTIQLVPETIETLGGGWIAEEALAISIYCSLVYENDFKKAVLLAVNHSGDSDSTGAITGNILGALQGTDSIPENWLARLELREEICEIAQDLLIGFRTGAEWRNKYPGV